MASHDNFDVDWPFTEELASAFPVAGSSSREGRLYGFHSISSTMDAAERSNPNEGGRIVGLFRHEETIPLEAKLPLPLPYRAVSIFCARHQFAGRGREERSWESSIDQGLYVTYRFDSLAMSKSLSFLPLAVGLAVRRAVAAFGPKIMLKWPNDLYARRGEGEFGKLGGILVDSTVEGKVVQRLLIGIGINLRERPELATVRGISLEGAATPQVTAPALLSVLTAELIDMLGVFWVQGSSPFLEEWRECDYLLGKRLEVCSSDGPPLVGIATGIAANGALRFRDSEGIETTVTGGHVRLLEGSESSHVEERRAQGARRVSEAGGV